MKLLILATSGALLLTSFLTAAEPSPGTQTAQTFTDQDGTLHYWLWLPKDPPAEGAPLLVFLHGSGERGDDLSMVKKHGPPKLVESMPALQQFILVSPQCPNDQRWDVALVKALTDSVVARCKADQKRLYLTGMSMGGAGTWAILAKYPDFFAAAVPICGRTDPKQAARLKDLPIRVFHGAKDEAVPLASSQEMVAALEAAGAKDVKLKIYYELGHDSWSPTYADPELYDWLLTKQRK